MLSPTLALVLLAGPDLKEYRWKARVAVVFGSDRLAKKQREILKGNGVKERDLVVLAGTPGMAKRFELSSSRAFAFVLVGKNGGVKLIRKKTPITREELFAIIDAMPMRRDEMRRGRGSH